MIPKQIHYFWFGGNPLPAKAQACVESWRRFLPDYEIVRWDEHNFNVNMISYTAQAYKAEKWAFVSDFARFWVLYKHGGLYFDTDVEIVAPIDDIIAKGPFMGCEADCIPGRRHITVAPGLCIGAEAGSELLGRFVSRYKTEHFDQSAGYGKIRTVVDIATELLAECGLRDVPGIQQVKDFTIYPSEYFCPRDVVSKRMHITPNTRAIHHYDHSWAVFSCLDKIKSFLWKMLPEGVVLAYNERKLMHK